MHSLALQSRPGRDARHARGVNSARVLRAARRTRRLSQRELAAIAGLPSSTLARIEAGRTEPRVSTLARALESLGYELVVCDHWGRLLTVDEERERLVDRAGRHFPAHLQSGKTPGPVEGGWWGWYRIAWWPREAPEYTYWRRRRLPQLGDGGGWQQEVWDDAT